MSVWVRVTVSWHMCDAHSLGCQSCVLPFLRWLDLFVFHYCIYQAVWLTGVRRLPCVLAWEYLVYRCVMASRSYISHGVLSQILRLVQQVHKALSCLSYSQIVLLLNFIYFVFVGVGKCA